MAVRVLARLLVLGGIALVLLVSGVALVTGTWGLLATTAVGLLPEGIGHDLWRFDDTPPATAAGRRGADEAEAPGNERAIATGAVRNDNGDDDADGQRMEAHACRAVPEPRRPGAAEPPSADDQRLPPPPRLA